MTEWLPQPGDQIQVVSQEGDQTRTAMRLSPAPIGSIWVVRKVITECGTAADDTWVVAYPQGKHPTTDSANLNLMDIRPYPVLGQPQVADQLPWEGMPLG